MNHQTGECSLSDCFCHEAQRLASSSSAVVVTVPTFEQEWHDAPRWVTRTTEEGYRAVLVHPGPAREGGRVAGGHESGLERNVAGGEGEDGVK